MSNHAPVNSLKQIVPSFLFSVKIKISHHLKSSYVSAWVVHDFWKQRKTDSSYFLSKQHFKDIAPIERIIVVNPSTRPARIEVLRSSSNFGKNIKLGNEEELCCIAGETISGLSMFKTCAALIWNGYCCSLHEYFPIYWWVANIEQISYLRILWWCKFSMESRCDNNILEITLI